MNTDNEAVNAFKMLSPECQDKVIELLKKLVESDEAKKG